MGQTPVTERAVKGLLEQARTKLELLLEQLDRFDTGFGSLGTEGATASSLDDLQTKLVQALVELTASQRTLEAAKAAMPQGFVQKLFAWFRPGPAKGLLASPCEFQADDLNALLPKPGEAWLQRASTVPQTSLTAEELLARIDVEALKAELDLLEDRQQGVVERIARTRQEAVALRSQLALNHEFPADKLTGLIDGELLGILQRADAMATSNFVEADGLVREATETLTWGQALQRTIDAATSELLPQNEKWELFWAAANPEPLRDRARWIDERLEAFSGKIRECQDAVAANALEIDRPGLGALFSRALNSVPRAMERLTTVQALTQKAPQVAAGLAEAMHKQGYFENGDPAVLVADELRTLQKEAESAHSNMPPALSAKDFDELDNLSNHVLTLTQDVARKLEEYPQLVEEFPTSAKSLDAIGRRLTKRWNESFVPIWERLKARYTEKALAQYAKENSGSADLPKLAENMPAFLTEMQRQSDEALKNYAEGRIRAAQRVMQRASQSISQRETTLAKLPTAEQALQSLQTKVRERLQSLKKEHEKLQVSAKAAEVTPAIRKECDCSPVLEVLERQVNNPPFDPYSASKLLDDLNARMQAASSRVKADIASHAAVTESLAGLRTSKDAKEAALKKFRDQTFTSTSPIFGWSCSEPSTDQDETEACKALSAAGAGVLEADKQLKALAYSDARRSLDEVGNHLAKIDIASLESKVRQRLHQKERRLGELEAQFSQVSNRVNQTLPNLEQKARESGSPPLVQRADMARTEFQKLVAVAHDELKRLRNFDTAHLRAHEIVKTLDADAARLADDIFRTIAQASIAQASVMNSKTVKNPEAVKRLRAEVSELLSKLPGNSGNLTLNLDGTVEQVRVLIDRSNPAEWDVTLAKGNPGQTRSYSRFRVKRVAGNGEILKVYCLKRPDGSIARLVRARVDISDGYEKSEPGPAEDVAWAQGLP